MTLKLYGTHTSPYVRHCRIALDQAGLDYDLVKTDYEQSADMSPTRRVPFMRHGEVELHDSLSILRYVREQAGQPFFPDLLDFDLFALVNTALDTAINLFILERDGLTPADSAYLTRQAGRVADLLDSFEKHMTGSTFEPAAASDGQIRLGCFLAWGRFRERFALSGHPNLTDFLERFDRHEAFARTAPRLD